MRRCMELSVGLFRRPSSEQELLLGSCGRSACTEEIGKRVEEQQKDGGEAFLADPEDSIN